MARISYKEKWKALGPPQLASALPPAQQDITWTIVASSRRGNWDRYVFKLHPRFDAFFADVVTTYKANGMDVMTEPTAQRPVRWGFVPDYNVQVVQAKLDHRGEFYDTKLFQVFHEMIREGLSPYALSSAPWVIGPGGKITAVRSGEGGRGRGVSGTPGSRSGVSGTPGSRRRYGTPGSAFHETPMGRRG